MTRRSVTLPLGVVSLVVVSCVAVVQTQSRRAPKARPGFSVVEASISDMQVAMKEGRVTSRELVRQYLARIGTYESTLHATLAVSAQALDEAGRLDRERAAGRVRGPLHGIPVALKDNIQTTNMPTTGGALAFDRLVPPYEATLARNLREAGAVIIAKTGMTELANWVAGDPDADAAQLQLDWRVRLQPVRPAARSAGRHVRWPARAADGRLELGRRDSGQPVGGQRRHRDIGVDSEPLEPEHARRHQTDRGTHQPLWRDSDYGRPGHAGTDGENSRRRRADAGCARRRRAGSPRPGDESVHATGWTAAGRLLALASRRRPAGRSHRHSAGLLLRPRDAARRI